MTRTGISLRAAALALAVLAGLATGAAAADWSRIRIGTEGAYKPFNFYDSAGKLQGFDIDIVEALCARLTASCELVAMQMDGLPAALEGGKIDAVATGWTITEKRLKVMDFTDRYYTNYRRFVTCPGRPLTDTSPAGLKGKALGAQGGTVSGDYLEATYKESEVKLYKSVDDAMADLGAGRLDAVFSAEAASYDWMQTEGGKGCTFVGERHTDPKLVGKGVGIALRKTDTELRDKLNEALKQIIADGTYDAIVKKYFPFPIY